MTDFPLLKISRLRKENIRVLGDTNNISKIKMNRIGVGRTLNYKGRNLSACMSKKHKFNIAERPKEKERRQLSSLDNQQ